jgi:hypothetical protein
LAFKVKVDKYQALYLKGIYEVVKSNTSNAQILSQCMGDKTISDALDYIRPLSETNLTNIVIPTFSAVVMVTDGIITKIEWDNGCWSGVSNCVDKKIPLDPKVTVGDNNFKYSDRNNYHLMTDCDSKV